MDNSALQHQDLKAFAHSENTLEILIEDNICLDKASLMILGENRNLLKTITEFDHRLEVEIYTGNPMFIELNTINGRAVTYVKGSGSNFYKNNN